MDQFFLSPYSVYQSQSTRPKKGTNARKRGDGTLDFDYFYSAVNASLKASNNKHPIDLVLTSPRVKLTQSENMKLENQDFCRLCVFTKAKKYRLSRYLLYILEATQNPPLLVFNKNAKAKENGTWISFKI